MMEMMDRNVFLLTMGGRNSSEQRIAALNGRPVDEAEWNDVLELVAPQKKLSDEEGVQLLKRKGLLPPTDGHAKQFERQHGCEYSREKPWVIFLHGVPNNEECSDSPIAFWRGEGAHGFRNSFCGNALQNDHERCMVAGVRPRTA